ncbi:hypothetical protein NFH98_20925 [Halomonas sp. H33-56]|uniref:hypothetical protein n=1 Tax=Halomonas sp. H33-56 TaxID=2950873 RepID=UPI0032DEBCAC
MPATWKTWSPNKIERFKVLHRDGVTYREIGKRMGLSYDQVRGAVRHYRLPTKSRSWQAWSREDYDRLEALYREGLSYRQIAERMGRSFNQVRCTTERLELRDIARTNPRERSDWPALDPIIRDCLEAELMTVPQIVVRLARLGHTVSRTGVHSRIEKMGQDATRRMYRNAARRRGAAGRRRGLRQRAKSAQPNKIMTL